VVPDEFTNEGMSLFCVVGCAAWLGLTHQNHSSAALPDHPVCQPDLLMPSKLCRGEPLQPFSGSKCIFTAVYTTQEGLRPWYKTRDQGFHKELQRFKSQLVPSIKRYVDPKIPVYTLVHKDHIKAHFSKRVDIIPLSNISAPRWAGQWYRQSFSKVHVPELALQKNCSRVLFLDNDVEIRKDITHLFDAEAPAFALDKPIAGNAMANSGIFLLDVNRTFVDSWKTFIKRKYKHRETSVKGPQNGGDQECWGDYFGKEMYQLPLNYNANYNSVKSQRIDRGNIYIAHYYPSNTRWQW